MSTAPDIQEAAPRPRRRYLRLKILAVLAILALGYLWFPRSMPDYIRLPAAHGPVEVKSWLTPLTTYRQFYVKTRVPKPWQEVLQELGPPQGCVTNFINWADQVKSIADEGESLTRSSQARFSARPLVRHGDYGDPLPPSFLVFGIWGPDDKKDSQHHNLFYRLTDHSGTETTVEVWDQHFFDH